MINSRYQTSAGSLKSLLLIDDIIEMSDDVVFITNPYMFDFIDNYNKTKTAGKKFVFGLDVNVAYGKVDLLRIVDGKPYSGYTLVVLNQIGYKNLVKLSTFSYREGMYQVPRVDWDTISKYNDGLACVINSYNSSVAINFNRNNLAGVDSEIKIIKSIFGNRLFFDKIDNYDIIDMSQYLNDKYQIQSINSRICLYKSVDDYEAFKYLVSINDGIALADVESVAPNVFFAKDVPQSSFGMFGLLSLIEDYNLDKIEIKIPPHNITDDEFKSMLRLKLSNKNIDDAVHNDRLDYELKTIIGFGYKDYFLIVEDLIKYCNDKLSGYFSAGRGSVGGCLVAYLLGITRIDPVKPVGFSMQIPFDRFLNSGRKVMPDIDMDFMPKDRASIIEYLQLKYGQDSVKYMTTQVTYGSRSSIREVCRVSGWLNDEMERIIKSFPSDQHLDLSMVKSSDIYTSHIDNKNFVKAFEIAEKLEGLPRSLGIHASGISLASYNMDDMIPFIVHNSGKEATQYDQEQLDYMGVIKLDVLGVNALQIIKDTVGLIHPDQKNWDHIDWLNSIPLDDKSVFTYINKGDISGVFQWDTHSYKTVIKLINPTNFQQLVDLNTLGRSAALLSGLTQKYADRKDGKELIEPLHPKLKGLMKDTYELPLYQEQIMLIFTSLVGYSSSEADDVRKAIGKKIPQLMEKQKKIFYDRCAINGIDAKDAEEIWFVIDKFSKYTWNLGHAVAYTKLCYETAYLSCHYPAEYYCTFINRASTSEDVNHFISALKKRGIKILPVNINESAAEYTVCNGQVMSGLSGTKFVGEKTIAELMKLRGTGFKSLDEIRKIPKTLLNKRSVISLLSCGAFDDFTKNGFDDFKRVFGFEDEEIRDALINQIKYSGKINRVPYHLFEEKYDTIVDLIHGKSNVLILGYIIKLKEIYTKSGQKMAFILVGDDDGDHEMTVFPSTWEKYESVVKVGELHRLSVSFSRGLVCNKIDRYEV